MQQISAIASHGIAGIQVQSIDCIWVSEHLPETQMLSLFSLYSVSRSHILFFTNSSSLELFVYRAKI